MNSRIAIGLIAGGLLIGCYWVEAQWRKGDRLPEDYKNGPEALAWLQRSDNESALASNRFGPTSKALQFVRALYSAGAVRVIVPEQCITKDDIETYADGLVVTLPTEPAKRAEVWRLCAAELAREFGQRPDEPDEDEVLLWWD